MQFSLFASIFLLFFLPLHTYAEIDGCEKTWLIKNLTIDEINENPSSAKNTAERKVLRLAFEKLIEKIIINPLKYKETILTKVKYEEIESMLDFKLVKSEKTLSNRYIATFSFCFLKEKVTQFLSEHNLAWSELQSRPIIVFPVWKNAFSIRLWKDPNPLKGAIEKIINSHSGLTELIFPKNKIGVLRSIDANLAYIGDRKSISRAIERSGASRALIINFELKKEITEGNIDFEELDINHIKHENLHSIKAVAYLHNNRGERQGTIYNNASYIDINDLEKNISFQIKNIILSLEEKWKQANQFVGNNNDKIQIFIYAKNIQDWSNAIRKLNSLPGVNEVYTDKLVSEGGYVNILVEGGINRFISIVLENKLPFSGTKSNLKLNSEKL